jgi:hypothetical protein
MRQHFPGQFGSGNLPDRKEWFQAGLGELSQPIVADIFEEQIAERYRVELLGDGTIAGGSHSAFVFRGWSRAMEDRSPIKAVLSARLAFPSIRGERRALRPDRPLG